MCLRADGTERKRRRQVLTKTKGRGREADGRDLEARVEGKGLKISSIYEDSMVEPVTL